MVATHSLIPPCCDSQEGIEITFFVPCLNEETRIRGTLETIRDAMIEINTGYEVIVVDDGCTDHTVEVVEAFAREHPVLNIRVHKNPCNLGVGRSFVDTAFFGKGRYYRYVCGDNVEPKETMVTVLRQRHNAEMVLPYYPDLAGKSAFRTGLSKVWTFLVDVLSGYRIRYYNGLNLYLRYHVMRWAPYSYGFGFQADLITALLEEGCSVVEVPVKAIHVDKGKKSSPLNLRNFLSVGYTLLRISLRRLKRTLYPKRIA